MITFEQITAGRARMLLALATLAACFLPVSALAVVEYDQNVTPDTIYGSGNSNGFFTTDRAEGVELGIRAKIAYNGILHSNGDGTYTYSTVEAAGGWNFDFSINTDYDSTSGLFPDDLTYELGMDADPGPGTNFFVFDPVNLPFADHSFGDNSTLNGAGVEAVDNGEYATFLSSKNVLQQSWRYAFFTAYPPLDSYNPVLPGDYVVYLQASDGDGVVARTEIHVIVEVPSNIEYEQNVTPDVIFGSGTGNGAFTTDRTNGVELGLRGKLRFNDANPCVPIGAYNSNGDGTYSFQAGNKLDCVTGWWTAFSEVPEWNFEFSVNSDYQDVVGDGPDARPLADLTYELGMDFDPSAAENFLVFDPINGPPGCFDHSTGNNDSDASTDTTRSCPAEAALYLADIGANNVAQNSWNYAFFESSPPPQVFDADAPGIYTIYLAAFDDGSPVARVEIQILVSAGPPVANDDSYDTVENDVLDVAAPGVLGNDTNTNGLTLEAALASDVGNGDLTLNGDGSFSYTPTADFCGTDSFTYTVSDGIETSLPATVTLNVACRPDITSISPAEQTADYSDAIATVTITAVDDDTPVEDGHLSLSWSGSPSDPATIAQPVEVSCVNSGDGQSCSWTVDGILDEAAAAFVLTFTANDGANDSTCSVTDGCTHTLNVQAEDAGLVFADYPIDNEVDEPDGVLGALTIAFEAWEITPDNATHGANIGTAYAGDLNNMVPQMRLTPVGPGGVVDADSCDFIEPLPDNSDGYDQVAYFECDFTDVEVNTYELEAYVNGGYYSGTVEDILVVSDPSLGFTTGGGFLYWPGTAQMDEEDDCYPYDGDKTNFGFNFKYNKKRKNVQGSLLVMRHSIDPVTCVETNYKVKSNSLDGMGLGTEEDSAGYYGWAAVSGKATFRDTTEENTGGNSFLLYIEDHGEQGCSQAPSDEFWIEVMADNVWTDPLGADPAVDEPSSSDETDAGDDLPIECGNIVVPHKTGKKGGGGGGDDRAPNPNKPPKG